MIRLDLDSTVEGSDWIKGRWDLVHVNSAAELNTWLYQRGLGPRQFKKMPVFKLNVESLAWLKAWAADTPPFKPNRTVKATRKGG